jgi:hypothetical protein
VFSRSDPVDSKKSLHSNGFRVTFFHHGIMMFSARIAAGGCRARGPGTGPASENSEFYVCSSTNPAAAVGLAFETVGSAHRDGGGRRSSTGSTPSAEFWLAAGFRSK